MSDYNYVFHKEKRVGRIVTTTEVREFKDCVATCGLEELKLLGTYSTWTNKQQGEARVLSQIDKGLVNFEWQVQLPKYEEYFCREGLYDHCTTILKLEKDMMC